MQLNINHLDKERQLCNVKLEIKCNLDKAKRLADDLYYVCADIKTVQVMGDSDNILYQTN